MVTWSVELFEYDIRYKPRGPVKVKALPNFATELVDDNTCDQPESESTWTLYVDDFSNL